MPDAKLEDGTILRFPDGTSQDVITKAVKKHMGLAEQIPLDQKMDMKSGAPARIRAVVGNAKNPEDAFKTLKQFYPDATPYGEDNFAFTDPETKRPTLFNPEGLDTGDLAAYGRVGAQMVGGVLGGAGGAFGAAPTGFLAAPVTVPTGAAMGSQMAGQIYDTGMRALGQVDSRSVTQGLTDAAGEMGAEAVFQKAAPMVTSALGRAGRGVASKIKGVADQRLLSGMAREGVPVEGAAGMISDSKVIQGATHALRVIPASANPMAKAATKTMDGIDRLFRGTVSKYGTGVTKEEGGAALQKGSQSFVNSFKDKASKMYDSLSFFIKDGDRVALPNTSAALAGNAAQFPGKENLQGFVVPRKFQGFLSDILDGDMVDPAKAGELTWKQLKTFRSAVGEMAGDPSVFSDIGKKQWKGLYAALSRDMEALASAKGDKALQAFNRANQFYRGGVQRIDDFMEKIVNSPTSEMAFNKALTGAKDGGTTLRALRKSIPKEQWDDFLSAKLNQMGMANPGRQGIEGDTFSPTTFLTNWGKLSGDAKAALFGGTPYKEAGRSLDTLLNIAERSKTLEAAANHSGTAAQTFYINLLTTGVTGGIGYGAAGAEGAATAVALPYMSAKLMTNPNFVRWLSRGIAEKAPNWNGVSAHLGRLFAIAKANPDIREEIYQFSKSLRDIPELNEAAGGDQQ